MVRGDFLGGTELVGGETISFLRCETISFLFLLPVDNMGAVVVGVMETVANLVGVVFLPLFAVGFGAKEGAGVVA